VIRMIATPHINIWAVALSRDGNRLATCGPDGTVRMWDVHSGTELWVSKHDAGELRFSIDDKRLVGRRADELRVWDARDGRFVWGGRDHEDPRGGPSGQRAVVTPDGRSSIEILAVGWCKVQAGCVTGEVPTSYVVKVIDLDTGRALHVSKEGNAAVAKLDVPIVDDKQSAHLKITGTLADGSYSAPNGELVFERTVRGLRNTVLLPASWDVSAVSQSATIGTYGGRAFVALINLNAENSYKVTIRARKRS